MDKVYVFGHQNPDTDSICSSISYAYLKSCIDSKLKYEAVSLKEINNETAFVLDYFDIEKPRIVAHLKPQVSDIDLRGEAAKVCEKDSIRDTLELLIKETGRSIPVVDENERLIGVVSFSDLVPRLLSLSDRTLLKASKTPLENVIKALELAEVWANSSTSDSNVEEKKFIQQSDVNGYVYVSVDVLDPNSKESVTLQDIVICHMDEIPLFYGQVGCLIVGNSPRKNIKDKYSELLEKGETIVYSSKKSAFELTKALAQATPIESAVVKKGLEYFVTYETIDDVKENMMSSKFRRFPVVDEDGRIKGMISRSDLVVMNRKKAILMDHNERGQSIEGIEDIEILEIIDHHRVADVQTISPLYFRVEPVGCTCTIVARMYEEAEVEIPKHIAGLMLSAILSDTLLFHSPTCTDVDKKTAHRLAIIADVDINQYGMKMIREGSSIQDESPADIINYDRKKFMFGDYKVTISQINTGDFDGFFEIYEDTVAEMERIRRDQGYDLVVLMVTDVVIGGTELIVIGDAKWIADSAFDIDDNERSVFLPDVFSRKKQVVPKLMNAAKL